MLEVWVYIMWCLPIMSQCIIDSELDWKRCETHYRLLSCRITDVVPNTKKDNNTIIISIYDRKNIQIISWRKLQWSPRIFRIVFHHYAFTRLGIIPHEKFLIWLTCSYKTTKLLYFIPLSLNCWIKKSSRNTALLLQKVYTVYHCVWLLLAEMSL